MMRLEKTQKFYDEIKAMGFLKRLFSWGSIITLLTESYVEIKKIDEVIEKNNELHSDLQVKNTIVTSLNDELSELKKKITTFEHEIKHNNLEIKKKDSEISKLTEIKEHNTDLIFTLKNDIRSLTEIKGNLLNELKTKHSEVAKLNETKDQNTDLIYHLKANIKTLEDTKTTLTEEIKVLEKKNQSVRKSQRCPTTKI